MSSQIKMFTAFIDINDSGGLAKALKQHKPQQTILQEVLNYAALMGDDQGIRVLFLNGAQATTQAYNYATKTTDKLGHGGHTLAGVYIKSIMKELITPTTPLSKLNFA